MDRFESMRAFVNVVDNGGFAAAARKVGMSRSAVNKHVHSLEDRLGAQLLTRSTRKVTPTETGYAFYERCIGILGELEAAEAAVSALHEEARGTLKINAPMTFGTMHLSRVVSDFMASHPDLRIELTLTDRFTDPVEEGADVTVRIAAPPKASHLIVHEIVEARRVVCASPGYLARNGEPLTPSDLSDHACLHYGYLATGNTWTFAGPDGDRSVHVNGVICSNNGQVLRGRRHCRPGDRAFTDFHCRRGICRKAGCDLFWPITRRRALRSPYSTRQASIFQPRSGCSRIS